MSYVSYTNRYRKLPVEIEARQLTAESYREFIESLTVEEFAAGGEAADGAVFLEIRTLEGVMRASEGDWIIRGVKGELYPCRDDIFRATYEPVLTGTERAFLSEGRALARCDRDEALAAVPSAVDRAGLRDRIRRAICEAEGFAWDSDMLEPDEYGDHADLVLAALPAPGVRAAVLREASVAVAALDRRKTVIQADTIRDAWEEGRDEGADLLRRMADEAQQPEARPSVEVECANCWRLIENRGAPSMGGPSHDNWVHVPGGFTVCFPQRGADSPRAEPKAAVAPQPGKET